MPFVPPDEAIAPWTTVEVRRSSARRQAAFAPLDDVLAAELVSDLLWRTGPAAIEERADGDDLRLIAGYRTAEAGEAALAVLAGAGLAAELGTVPDGTGLDDWRDHATSHRAGPFLLRPPWRTTAPEAEPSPVPPSIVLDIDPGRAFGSGSHPTTRLCLEQLARRVRPGDHVLDVGSGSGVLAVAAARLGAARVDATDIDPAAPATIDANAAANGASSVVHATSAPLADLVASGLRAEIVVANLLAPIVIELAEDLVAATAPGGLLIVSGLLASRWSPAIDALAGVRVIDLASAGGWVAVTARAPRNLTS